MKEEKRKLHSNTLYRSGQSSRTNQTLKAVKGKDKEEKKSNSKPNVGNSLLNLYNNVNLNVLSTKKKEAILSTGIMMRTDSIKSNKLTRKKIGENTDLLPNPKSSS